MLKKKMFRDIKNNLSQFITIFLMVAIGVMAYFGIEAYMSGMQETADKFYTENNLQDLNVVGINFTESDLKKIKSIDNVKDAERKLSITGSSNNDKTLLLNFIEENNISKFYVKDGEKFDKNKSGVWLDEFYAKENNISVGDNILIKYDSFSKEEVVLGLINVPDHIYDTKDSSELYPNRKEFGFAYLSINELPEEYQVYNYVMVDVDNKDNVLSVKENIEKNVESALGVIKIEDTASYKTYQGEVDEGKTYIGVFSGLFLFIAMLSVITTMNRVIKNERIEIGTLKALGFSNSKVLFHYIGYGFWISLFAAIAGLFLGYFFIGNIFISLEMSFFEVPNGHPVVKFSGFILAAFVVLLVSFITYLSSKSILKENPAESLRKKMPKVKKNSLNLTTKGFLKNLSFSSKWNIRDMLRNKMRTIMGVVGVASSCMLIVCALGMLNSMNYFIDLQFEKIYNFDYKLNLMENLSDEELESIESIYGNESSKSYGIEIKNEDGKESNNLFVTDASDYIRFVDNKYNFIKLDNDEGVYITYKLAKNENKKVGDTITWHIYGSDTYYTSKIVGLNKDPQNQNISATRKYLESLGIKYTPDSIYTNKDLKDVSNIKNVTVIQDKDALKESMDSMLSMMKTMLTLIIGIAAVLGIIIIYNLGILSFTEKEYQFATLKVLGFSDKKIKGIFIKQNNWIAIMSIIIGLPLGYYLTDWLFKTAIEEHYDFGANIEPLTYIIALIGTFVISYLVSKFLARKVNKIDMVSSLKGNE